jgi:hypothetical protein
MGHVKRKEVKEMDLNEYLKEIKEEQEQTAKRLLFKATWDALNLTVKLNGTETPVTKDGENS